MAAVAASWARFSPLARPIPISAVPASCIMLFTSAKSALTIPWVVIKSEMPAMPWRKTSSTVLNASIKEVFLSIICKMRSLWMEIMASTLSFKLS